MASPPNIREVELLYKLMDALQQIPGVRAEMEDIASLSTGPAIDAILSLHIGEVPVRLAVECKRQIYPRDVRHAVWQLRAFISKLDNGVAQWAPIVAAEEISPGARELLHSEGVGYFDSGGSLYLSAQGVFLLVDKPPTKAARRKMISVFKGRRALVLHALWDHRLDWLGVHQIAALAGVAPATASETLVELERQNWVETRGAGPTKERYLKNPGALLDAWSDYGRTAPPPASKTFFVPERQIEGLMQRLDRACAATGVSYAVTGEAAAQVYAPYMSSISRLQCRMLAGAPADAALRELGARPVTEGWNLSVILVETEEDLLFRQRGPSAWLASPLQVYLDLLQGSGRSPEMAAHLRQERLQ